MATGKITKTTVDNLAPSPSSKVILWDEKVAGFGVYVTPSGTRGYVLQYRMGGRGYPTRRYTIGRHGSPWTPDKARQRALELLYQVYQGIDPLLAEQQARAVAEVDEKLRFSTYIESFDKLYLQAKNLRSARNVRAVLKVNALPAFGEQPITTITKQQIVALMDELSERNKHAARHTFAALRLLTNFAVTRSDLETSPLKGLKMPHKPTRRTRILSDQELLRAWEASADMGYPYGPLIQMLILTGQRLKEVAHATWSELDLRDHLWTLPAERTKNKRIHLVPISEDMLEFLNLHWPADSREGLLYRGKRGNRLTTFSTMKDHLDAYIARRVELAASQTGQRAEPVPHFVLHDLRRTMASGLRRLGVTLETTEVILNHVSGTRSDLVETYQRYDLAPEKSQALQSWHRHIKELLGSPDAWPGGKELPLLDIPSPQSR